jgi:hypothetical protein
MVPIRSAFPALAAGLAVAACSMPTGEGERQEAAKQEAAERAKAGAEGKAEEGRLSIQAPGLDIAINVPDAMRGRARADTDSDVLPPDARVSGLHVQGDGGDRAAGRDSVELRFSSSEPPERLAAWYRDPARRDHLTISEARREGDAIVLSGAAKDGGPVTVRLSPRAGAGTDGRLILVDRD